MLQYYFNSTRITLAEAAKLYRGILKTRKTDYARLAAHNNGAAFIGIPLSYDYDCDYLGITLCR